MNTPKEHEAHEVTGCVRCPYSRHGRCALRNGWKLPADVLSGRDYVPAWCPLVSDSEGVRAAAQRFADALADFEDRIKGSE